MEHKGLTLTRAFLNSHLVPDSKAAQSWSLHTGDVLRGTQRLPRKNRAACSWLLHCKGEEEAVTDLKKVRHVCT